MGTTLLAIDPGTYQSGYVILEGEEIVTSGVEPNDAILLAIQNRTEKFELPQMLAIENMVSYGNSVGKSTFTTCIWIGRFYQAWLDLQHPQETVVLVDRVSIKSHICPKQKSNDSTIIKALTERLGAKGTKANPGKTYGVKSHAWQALALGVYCYDKMLKVV
jgi:Tfp pilus assembly protein PilX